MRPLLLVLLSPLIASLAGGAITVDFPVVSPAESANGIPAPVLEAFQAGRYEDALAKAAAAGPSPGTLYMLGWLHETGSGVPADSGKAVDYYQRARDAGHPQAVYRLAIATLDHVGAKAGPDVRALLEDAASGNPGTAGLLLGELHARGLVGPANFELARSWWTRSAEAGEVRGRHNLGRLLDGSFGFPEKRDAGKAIESFQAAADAGYADAMASLGSRLMHGAPGVRDERAGLDWLRKAAAAGSPDAHFVIGNYYEYRKKDFSNALRAYHAGGEQDSILCLLRAGEFYSGGIGTTTDPARALELFRKAAALGSHEGDFRTAVALLREAPDEAAVLQGYKHLLGAARAGHARAQNELGVLYLSGRLGAADPSAAASWLDHSAAQDFASAQNNLAALFEKGLGVTLNFTAAAKLYTKAAGQGHPAATTALARLHAEGRGVPRNLPRAWALASLAAGRGDPNGTVLRQQLAETLGPDNLDAARRILAELRSQDDRSRTP